MPKIYISSAATWIFVHSLLWVRILGILTCMCVFTTSAGCVTKLAKNPAPVKSFVFSKSSWHENYWHTKTSGSCFNEDNCKLLTKACHNVASVGRGVHPAWNLLLQHLIGSQVERRERHIPVQKKRVFYSCEESRTVVSPDKGWYQASVETSQSLSPDDLTKTGAETKIGEPPRFRSGGYEWSSALSIASNLISVQVS